MADDLGERVAVLEEKQSRADKLETMLEKIEGGLCDLKGDVGGLVKSINGTGTHNIGLIKRVEDLELDRAEIKATARTVKAVFGFLILVGGPVFYGIVWLMHNMHILPDTKGGS
jgi:hypothetical protein